MSKKNFTLAKLSKESKLSNKKLNQKVDSENRFLIKIQKPDAIVFRLFEVLSSWQKNTVETITFIKDNFIHFVNKNKNHLYIINLINDLREQSIKDNKVLKECPVICPLSSNILKVGRTALSYLSWKLTIDGNIDLGSYDQPHNKLCRLIAFEGYRSNKLQFYLYDDVKKNLEKWHKQGIRLIIYSCLVCEEIWDGKNLLAFTFYGNLSNLFEFYIDSAKSPLLEDNSYINIIKKFGTSSKLLFVTANIIEARYAKKNNINPLIMMREDSLIDTFDKYFDDIPVITRFDEITFVNEKEIKNELNAEKV